MQVLVAHALGRQLDRRQRVLDLVGEASRDFAPGRIPLCLQQRRDVIEYDDVAGSMIFVAGKCRARASQHATPDFAAQHDLFAPFGFTSVEMHPRDVNELVEQ